ncbi:hypothetical protein B0H11DRAFT_2405828 [Mycena galericulata]|nr:hypothetical protein B0H11DRAFT_2405828 [Mycena galericulata]
MPFTLQFFRPQHHAYLSHLTGIILFYALEALLAQPYYHRIARKTTPSNTPWSVSPLYRPSKIRLVELVDLPFQWLQNDGMEAPSVGYPAPRPIVVIRLVTETPTSKEATPVVRRDVLIKLFIPYVDVSTPPSSPQLPWATMRIPSLLISVFSLHLVRSVQINTTIDDANPLVTYRAPVLNRNPTWFNSSLLNNGTVTFVPPTQDDSPTIAMNFTGTAVYIFVAQCVPSGGWAIAQTAPLYNHLAYRNTTLANAPHSLVIQIQPEWELYFDYVVYTSGAPESLVSSTRNTEKKFPVGALVGGVIGGLIFLGLVAMPWCLRRRAPARQKANPFTGETSSSEQEVLDKEGPPSPVTPFMLQSQSKRSRESKKSAHGVGVHTAQLPGEAANESPISAISDNGYGLGVQPPNCVGAAAGDGYTGSTGRWKNLAESSGVSN